MNTADENVSSPAIKPPSTEELDYRDLEDDAWYTVSIRLENAGEILVGQDEGLHLRVMYNDFDEKEDRRYGAEYFEGVSDLDEFAKRFRVVLPQLQDSECWKVVEGVVVCASYPFEENGLLKFYDAIVKSVHKFKHKFFDGKETCQCLFDLQWQHGPKQGITTSRTIDCICYNQDQQPGTVNSDLDTFIYVTREKLKLESSHYQHGSTTINNKNTFSGTFQKRNQIQRSEYKISSLKNIYYMLNFGNAGISYDDEEDADLGDGEIHQPWSHSTSAVAPSLIEMFFYVFIENLGIDILPENIEDFLYKHTHVSSRALVFPAFGTAFFTRGVIITHSMDEIMKIVNFIHNPSHIIVSTGGRPWVTPEKRWRHGSLGGLLSNIKMNPIPKLGNPSMAKINLFSKGTAEFDKGKLLRDLFLEFYNNVRGVSERFAFEEHQLTMSFR